MYCVILYCVVLYCIVLYCVVLCCIVLYCIVLQSVVLYCIILYFIVLWSLICLLSMNLIITFYISQEPLKDYIRSINSVKVALQQRFDKKNEYLSALTDVEAKQIAHNKLAIQGNKEEKAAVKQVNSITFSFISSDTFISCDFMFYYFMFYSFMFYSFMFYYFMLCDII